MNQAKPSKLNSIRNREVYGILSFTLFSEGSDILIYLCELHPVSL